MPDPIHEDRAPVRPKPRRRQPKGALVCFEGTMMDVGDTEKASFSVEGCSIVVASHDRVVTGRLHFMSPKDATTGLEKIRAGELFYVASKPYLDGLPVAGGMDGEWQKLRRLAFIGIEWDFCGHHSQWGIRKSDDRTYEPLTRKTRRL